MHLETVELESREELLFSWKEARDYIESPTFASVNLIVGLFGANLC